MNINAAKANAAKEIENNIAVLESKTLEDVQKPSRLSSLYKGLKNSLLSALIPVVAITSMWVLSQQVAVSQIKDNKAKIEYVAATESDNIKNLIEEIKTLIKKKDYDAATIKTKKLGDIAIKLSNSNIREGLDISEQVRRFYADIFILRTASDISAGKFAKADSNIQFLREYAEKNNDGYCASGVENLLFLKNRVQCWKNLTTVYNYMKVGKFRDALTIIDSTKENASKYNDDKVLQACIDASQDLQSTFSKSKLTQMQSKMNEKKYDDADSLANKFGDMLMSTPNPKISAEFTQILDTLNTKRKITGYVRGAAVIDSTMYVIAVFQSDMEKNARNEAIDAILANAKRRGVKNVDSLRSKIKVIDFRNDKNRTREYEFIACISIKDMNNIDSTTQKSIDNQKSGVTKFFDGLLGVFGGKN